MKIEDLKPAEYNPRSITPEALEGLRSSIGEFGDISGIVWNKRTGNLVAGHQRLQAVKDAAVEGPEVRRGKLWAKIKVQRGKKKAVEEIRLPIRVVNWGVTKEKAANIAANNPHIEGAFTREVLGLIEELEVDAETLTVDIRLNELAGDFLAKIDTEGGVTDPYGEWDGMPEFAQPDTTAYRTLIVHFITPEDLEGFLKKIGQTVTEKTKFIYIPKQKIAHFRDKSYE